MTSMKNFLKFKTRQNSSDVRKFGEEYYMREAKLWRPFRLFGVFAHVSAMIFILSALASSNWVHGKDLQNAIIGLMIFATIFGFIASVLSICGVCTNPLPRKIYYFHSAGEIFFICAVSASIALIVFPIAIELDNSIGTHHRYGIGYGLGWGGAFFFLAAAVCMSLDDLVRESSRAKCCRWCWRSKHSDRNDLRQV